MADVTLNHYLEALAEQVPRLRDELEVPPALPIDAASNARIGWR